MSVPVKEGDKGEHSESGFYCEDCDCIVKDSLNYLDHINGKRHNRNVGVSLKKFTDSTLEEVKQMLELKKREREDKANGYSFEEEEEEDNKEEDEERWRRLKREKKKRQKARRSGTYQDDGEEKDEDDFDEDEDQGERDEDEDAMAKLMGFSSFSTSKTRG